MNDDVRTRAGRLRLLARRDVAGRASELLQSKEEALERERARLEGYARRAGDEWRVSIDTVHDALVRARMLGGCDEIDRVSVDQPARIVIDWQTSMGIAYPADVDVERGRGFAPVSTAALRPVIDCAGTALDAAVRHAAASLAVRRIESELVATRRRRRAIDDRMLPSLDAQLHRLELHLDELDRAEAMRVRLAIGRRQGVTT